MIYHFGDIKLLYMSGVVWWNVC